MAWVSSVLLCLVALLLGAVVYLVKRQYRFWSKRNIPQVDSSFPFGSLKDVGSKLHFVEVFDQAYHRFKDSTPVVGIYLGVSPMLAVLDLDLVKHILVKDFNSMHGRGMYVNERDDPISAHLFSLEGERWRLLRNKLSPTFTSGKLKYMFDTIREVGDEFLHSMDPYIDQDAAIDIKKLCQCFTCDVVGSCAFGLQCNSLRNGGSKLLDIGDRLFKPSKYENLRAFFQVAFKDLARALRMRILPKDVATFFTELIRSTVEHREQNAIQRSDFLNLLIQLKNKGTIEDGVEHSEEKLTLDEITAQAFIFFFAGFETSAAALSFAMFLLANHPEIQERVRKEVLDKLQLHNNEITYDALKEMTYLDQVINETLRMFPSVPQLFRTVNETYHIESSNVTLEKGTMLTLPVYSYHYDPAIYPEPTRFDPDRFAPEAVRSRHSYAFLPFGDGPRNCIGMRFGLLEIKFGIVQLLSKLRFTVSERTKLPLTIAKDANFLTAEGGLWLNAKRL